MLRTVLIFSVIIAGLADSDEHISFTSSQTHAEVSAYWTRERMEAAIARDISIDRNKQVKPQHTQVAQDINQNPEFDESHMIPSNIPDHMEHKKERTSDINQVPQSSYPFPFTAGYADDYVDFPYSTVGRVFYTQAGIDYAASASVVGKYIIITSGDIAYSFANQVWSTNIYFTPGSNYGSAPMGTFTYFKSFVNKQFSTNGLQSYNLAIIVLYPDQGSGYPISGITGNLGFAFNQSVTNCTWRVTGYPAVAPFTGWQNYYTDSPFGVLDTTFGSSTIGVGNNGTGGIGGSPYVLYWGSYYFINSVVAYKYETQPLAVYGPYFGTAAYNLYVAANSIVPPSPN